MKTGFNRPNRPFYDDVLKLLSVKIVTAQAIDAYSTLVPHQETPLILVFLAHPKSYIPAH